MKKFKLNFLVPIVAVVIAISASAFTTHADDALPGEVQLQGYILNANPQQPCESVQADCSLEGDYVCKIGTQDVYRFQGGTTCTTELRRNTP